MHQLLPILDELRDFDHIEHMFTEERKVNPALDAWFRELLDIELQDRGDVEGLCGGHCRRHLLQDGDGRELRDPDRPGFQEAADAMAILLAPRC